MKKHLILLLMASIFTFTACSSDDDDNDDKTGEPIIGTWVLVNVNSDLIDIDACENPSTITLNENNTGSATFYFEDNNCEAATSQGTWENLGNGEYEINVPFQGLPVTSGSVEFNGANEFFLLASGLTFTFQRQ